MRKVNITEVVSGGTAGHPCGDIEADALRLEGALQEAALVDVQIDYVRGLARLLFDCRGALQIRESNTAVVVIRNVTSGSWDITARGPRIWHAVVGWEPVAQKAAFSARVYLAPDGELQIHGQGAELWLGDTSEAEGAPPNYVTATDEEIRHGTPSWTSAFTVNGVSAI